MQSNSACKTSKQIDRLKVKSLLALRDETVADLARALDKSPVYFYELLKGTRNPTDYVSPIAAYLGVPEQTILLSEDDNSRRAA